MPHPGHAAGGRRAGGDRVEPRLPRRRGRAAALPRPEAVDAGEPVGEAGEGLDRHEERQALGILDLGLDQLGLDRRILVTPPVAGAPAVIGSSLVFLADEAERSPARAAHERSRFPHREAIDRKSYDTARHASPATRSWSRRRWPARRR
jgi:hypothetical protein